MSDIEWTSETWNPVVGCDPFSPGCNRCYAARMAWRLGNMEQEKYAGLARRTPAGQFVWTGEVRCVPEALRLPYEWRTAKRVFVNSMGDTFHEDVPLSFIQAMFNVMVACPHLTFQVLTKRADRLLELSRELPWPPNVWCGVSVEDRARLDRIDRLRQVPAAVRFLSLEPLLEPLGTIDLTGIHWVIVGGESGHGCRPFDPDWARDIRDQCASAKVPFFMKQLGGHPRKRSGLADLPADLQIREFPAVRAIPDLDLKAAAARAWEARRRAAFRGRGQRA